MIHRELLKDTAGLALGVAGHIANGAVKIAQPAVERAGRYPLRAALEVRSGEVGDDPLRQAVLLAVWLALDQMFA